MKKKRIVISTPFPTVEETAKILGVSKKDLARIKALLAKPKPKKGYIVGDDGHREVPCEHGVGHGLNVHTCDGCCRLAPLKNHKIFKKKRK
jgi:hypothetical protein